jgi:hypothetical protein
MLSSTKSMTDSTTRIFSTGVQAGIVEGRGEEGGLFVEIGNLNKKSPFLTPTFHYSCLHAS